MMAYGVREPEDRTEVESLDVSYVESLLLALMQIERPITLEAARSLLNHEWAGMHKIQETYFSFCEDLDDDTREMWYSAVLSKDNNQNRQ